MGSCVCNLFAADSDRLKCDSDPGPSLPCCSGIEAMILSSVLRVPSVMCSLVSVPSSVCSIRSCSRGAWGGVTELVGSCESWDAGHSAREVADLDYNRLSTSARDLTAGLLTGGAFRRLKFREPELKERSPFLWERRGKPAPRQRLKLHTVEGSQKLSCMILATSLHSPLPDSNLDLRTTKEQSRQPGHAERDLKRDRCEVPTTARPLSEFPL